MKVSNYKIVVKKQQISSFKSSRLQPRIRKWVPASSSPSSSLSHSSNLHKTTLFRSASAAAPTTYFEVTRPIPLPKTQPCSHLVLHHEFAHTYNKPPILASYTPPPNCPNFEKVVLEWTATCKGRQYDRIFGVWLAGAEILRSCTAEPPAAGIVWTVKKDVTRYRSLLMKEQNMSVYMGNIVDATYNGVYHVNVTFHFYPAVESHDRGGSWADLVLPISRNYLPPLSNGLWFEIENSSDVQGKELEIPKNAYRAVLEMYVSFHENDEFWYSNFPNEYISINNLTNVAGNGPFREVVVRLDMDVVGAVWPFTVIYTGGVNPFLWRPISGIGSFNLPSYDIEITPFLGRLLDGKPHFFAFSVTNALNVWYVDANLHLWLDKKWEKTHGKLLEHTTSPVSISTKSSVSTSVGMFTAQVSRSIVSRGFVRSSRGLITTKSSQELRYSNVMELRNDGNFQVLNQTIKMRGKVAAKKPRSTDVFSTDSRSKYGVYLYSNGVDGGNGTTESYRAKVKLDLEEKRRRVSEFGSWVDRVKNLQSGEGYLGVEGKSIHGLGSTKQDYRYISDQSCFFRKVRSSNYTILHDHQSSTCK